MLDWEDHEDRMLRLFRLHYNEELVDGRTSIRDLLKRISPAISTRWTDPGPGEGTAFQQEVWTALRTIPAGTTLSYSGWLNRSAVRRRPRRRPGKWINPIGVVVPVTASSEPMAPSPATVADWSARAGSSTTKAQSSFRHYGVNGHCESLLRHGKRGHCGSCSISSS